MRTRLPSVVVIQERHIKYGERFKIMKVNNRRRREYVLKFLSAKKFTFRFKSKQVIIGRKTKELKYKGSPLAISRLLLLDGFKDPFPQFGQNSRTCENLGSETREADSATSPTALNPPLSFFNLSDRRPTTTDRRPTTTTSRRDSAEINVGSASKPNNGICPQVDLTCLPQRLNDFHLLFGSDTADSDEDSDAGEDELITVEVDDTILPSQNNTDKKQQNAMNNTIKKIEKDVKHISASLRDALEAAAQKVTVTFPPTSTISTPTQTSLNNEHFVESGNSENQRNQINFVNGQRIPRNNNCSLNPLNCPYLQPSGSVPFFRVPGGCIMVVQATNQTTPVLFATFMTGNSYHQQYQQVQVPIYGMCQTVSIHIGPYRLGRDEMNRIFNFINNSSISMNPARF